MSRLRDSKGTSREIQQTSDEFLEDFKESCKVDWRLAESTTKERMRYAKKLVDLLDGHPITASKQDLRNFVQRYEDDNAIKTIRVIYGRYLDTEIADSFKLPQPEPRPKIVPKKAELKQVFQELESQEMKTAFLILASSGLRRHELIELTPDQIDFEERMIYPDENGGRTTKRQWITLYNQEAETRLLQNLKVRKKDSDKAIFGFYPDTLTRRLREASERANTRKVTPQVLRVWFCNEMNSLGVADRYIDAFCGRVPRTVLGKHYSDFSPEKLKEVYEKASISVLS